MEITHAGDSRVPWPFYRRVNPSSRARRGRWEDPTSLFSTPASPNWDWSREKPLAFPRALCKVSL